MTQNGNDRFIFQPQQSKTGPLSSGLSALSEDFQKTLKEAELNLNRQQEEAQKLKANPETAIREQEEAIRIGLERAKSYYRKKEYQRSFMEWEKVCAFLDENDRFKQMIRELKQSHEGLAKVNGELFQIRGVLKTRFLPASSDAKFLEQANQNVTRQVKSAYANLSSQLRSERVPKTLSFWWPVALAAGILLMGFLGLSAYQSVLKKQTQTGKMDSAENQALDAAYLQAQRNAMDKQVEALNVDYEIKMQDLSRKHAEASKHDRERIIQLETKLREAESQNYDLEKQVKALFEDNFNKDKVIASLD